MRPDHYVAARWHTIDPAAVDAASSAQGHSDRAQHRTEPRHDRRQRRRSLSKLVALHDGAQRGRQPQGLGKLVLIGKPHRRPRGHRAGHRGSDRWRTRGGRPGFRRPASLPGLVADGPGTQAGTIFNVMACGRALPTGPEVSSMLDMTIGGEAAIFRPLRGAEPGDRRGDRHRAERDRGRSRPCRCRRPRRSGALGRAGGRGTCGSLPDRDRGADGGNAGELARLLTLEQGKPLNGLGSRWEMGGAAAWAGYTSGLSLPPQVLQDTNEGKVEVHRKPIGVVGFDPRRGTSR